MASEFPVDGQDSGFIELAVGFADAVVLEGDGPIGVEEIDAADEGTVGVVDAGLLEGGGEAGLEKGDLDIGFAGAFREIVDEADGGAGGYDAGGFSSLRESVEEFVFGGEVGGEGKVATADGLGKTLPAGDIDDRQGREVSEISKPQTVVVRRSFLLRRVWHTPARGLPVPMMWTCSWLWTRVGICHRAAADLPVKGRPSMPRAMDRRRYLSSWLSFW